MTGLGITQTNMEEDNTHPTKKSITRAAEMIEIDSHQLSQHALQEPCVGWEAANRRSERRKPLSSERPIFRKACHRQETEAIAEALAAQANESSRQNGL